MCSGLAMQEIDALGYLMNVFFLNDSPEHAEF